MAEKPNKVSGTNLLQNPRPGFVGDQTPELCVDHLVGILTKHGTAKMLFMKHRPVIGIVDGQMGANDSPVESCILSISEGGLRELSGKLVDYLEKRDASNKNE